MSVTFEELRAIALEDGAPRDAMTSGPTRRKSDGKRSRTARTETRARKAIRNVKYAETIAA